MTGESPVTADCQFNGYAFYASGSYDGADASSPLDLCNNIFDGSGIGISGIATLTENYNNIGGAQGTRSSTRSKATASTAHCGDFAIPCEEPVDNS